VFGVGRKGYKGPRILAEFLSPEYSQLHDSMTLDLHSEDLIGRVSSTFCD
jgi:hypothetical protein